MKKFIPLLIFLLLWSSFILAEGEIIDGNSVYVNNSDAFIKATPHELTYDGWVNVELISKQFSGDVNAIFGFNTSSVKPIALEYYNPQNNTITVNNTQLFKNVTSITTTSNNCEVGNGQIKRYISLLNTSSYTVCFDHYNSTGDNYNIYWYTDEQEETFWQNKNDIFNKIERNLNGKDTWYYTTNVPITANDTYNFRMYLDINESSLFTKYDIAFYPSSYGSDVISAYNNGHLLLLDPTVNLTDTIRTYWKLDQNLSDAVGSDDLINNGATATSSGKISGAYNFDGTNDYMVIPALGDLGSGSAYSFNAWVNLDATGDVLLARQDSNDFGIYLSGSTTIQFTSDGTGFNAFTVADYSSGWHMITVTCDGSNARVYLDATQSTTGAVSEGCAWPNVNFNLGKYNSGFEVDGIIDEVGVWTDTLNSSEITELYNSGDGLSYPFESGEEPADPCTYGGSGDWTLNISDNCNITTSVDLGTNNLFVVGDAGRLSFQANITTAQLQFTPDDYDGDSIIEVTDGNRLVIG